MKPWQIAIVVSPLFIGAYAVTVAGGIWLAQRLPESWLKRLLLKRWDSDNR